MKHGNGILAAKLTALLCATLFLSGCAAIFRGTTQLVPVDSVPTGAEVIVNGELVGRTPLEVELGRASEHVITLRWNGQERSFTLRPQLDGEGGALLVADAAPGGVLVGVSAIQLATCPPVGETPVDEIPFLCRYIGFSEWRLGMLSLGVGAVAVAIPVAIDVETGGIMQLSPSEIFVAFE